MARVLFVIGSLDVGGAETHLVHLLPMLRKHAWQVEVYCLSARGEMAPLLEKEGIKVHSMRATSASMSVLRHWQLCKRAFELCVFLRKARPDIVHFFLPAAYVVGGICSLMVGTRYRVMSRRSLNRYQKEHRVAAVMERYLHRRMDAVLGNSKAVVRELALEGVDSGRLRLIYNGINVTRFDSPRDRHAVRNELGISDDAIVMVNVANLIPYKGHKDLLHALELVVGAFPRPWRLVCVGKDNGSLQELQNVAAGAGVAANVIWLGQRLDIPDLLAASDIGVLASHQEGFSNALLEYMAAGLPTVSTNVGGNQEAVGDDGAGIVVPPHSPSDLGLALLRLAADDRLRSDMGSKARHRAEADFSLKRSAMAYSTVYASILKREALPVIWSAS